MADKQYFSVVLTVDLSCDKCNDKIKKVLSKYEDRWNIRSVVWDEKHNKVTLTGPFCPRKLSKKLCNKACKVIESYHIPDLCECDDDKDKPAAAKPPEPKKDLPKPAPAKAAEPKKDPPKPETPKPAPAKPDGPKKDVPPKPENPKPAPPPPPAPKPEAAPPPPKADKPAPAPPQPKTAEELISPVAVPDPYPPVWPVCFGGPWCQCGAGGGYAPWGCNCGCGCGHGGGGGHGCGRSCHAGCQVEFFCEEDSSCRPM